MTIKKPNFKRLEELTEEGYLRKVISPCGKLFLYNYTDKTTYEKKWTKHTLNARGTVYEVGTNKMIAKAFPKFFNFGELATSKSKNLLKQQGFDVFEKMDGSLGIIYFYDGAWRVNTRGSFTSDQAIKATEMLSLKYNMTDVPKDVTILAEIIYPENRIIVDYGQEEKLTVIGAYDLEHGSMDLMAAENFSNLKMYLSNTGLETAPSTRFKTIQDVIDMQATLGKMEEGFVVRFQDGYRAKFKSAEYLKVARLLSEMTLLNFWKAMKEGIVQQEIIEEIPEEFRPDVDRMKGELEESYKKVCEEVYWDFDHAMKCIGGLFEPEDNRKKLGIFLKENPNELKHSGAMFSMLLNKGLDKYIMKSIRPHGNQVVVL